MFNGKKAALKEFRNCNDEKAFKEIKMMFALRHPNIIGLYAWYRAEGAISQVGAVIELAAGGDLGRYYKKEDYEFFTALKIIAGVAKGMAYMHSMPAPVVHRDLKSANVLIMEDGVSAKIGDCGESRRLDLNSTMTSTGTPLWAAVGFEMIYFLECGTVAIPCSPYLPHEPANSE